MKKALLIILLNSAFATYFASAQPTRTPPTPAEQAQRRVDQLTRLLTLTSAQQQQALTIFTNSATAEAGLHDSMKTARDAISAAVKVNDTATIDRTATTIGNLEAQQISIESKADAALYLILTPDQQAKLPAMLGPGGPGFGPGPRGRGPGPNFRAR
jgi:Spy/CpxP family protein refolding chaperone